MAYRVTRRERPDGGKFRGSLTITRPVTQFHSGDRASAGPGNPLASRSLINSMRRLWGIRGFGIKSRCSCTKVAADLKETIASAIGDRRSRALPACNSFIVAFPSIWTQTQDFSITMCLRKFKFSFFKFLNDFFKFSSFKNENYSRLTDRPIIWQSWFFFLVGLEGISRILRSPSLF